MDPTDRIDAARSIPDVSIQELFSIIWHKRWLMVVGATIGGAIALVPTFIRTTTYSSTATVIPSSSDQGGSSSSGLRGIASQFGLGNISGLGGSAVANPDFINRIARSNVVRRRMMLDTIVAPEIGGKKKLIDLLAPRAASVRTAESASAYELRTKRALRKLARWASTSKAKDIDAVELRVATPWPSVSLQIARQLLGELNAYTLELGRQAAHEERRFIQQRVSERDAELRVAERRLSSFIVSNREFRSSPTLVFEYDRLARDVEFHQQILTSLIQSSEDAQIRELRDTPTLQVLEPPLLPAERDPKGRLLKLLLGAIGGAVVVALIVLVRSPIGALPLEARVPSPVALPVTAPFDRNRVGASSE